jgi:hypothetical protein
VDHTLYDIPFRNGLHEDQDNGYFGSRRLGSFSGQMQGAKGADFNVSESHFDQGVKKW